MELSQCRSNSKHWFTTSFGGQLRGDKECPFSGVTKYGRVWRKVLESNARSASVTVTNVSVSHSVICVATTLMRLTFHSVRDDPS